MAKDDFLIGLLQGLYQGGVGNPQVNRANRAQRLQESYLRQKQDADARARGERPVGGGESMPPPGSPGAASKIGAFISNIVYPGAGFGQQTTPQYETDPDPMSSYNLKVRGDIADIKLKEAKAKKLMDSSRETEKLTEKIDLTPAQKKVDETFGKEYAKYTNLGGYADSVTQISTLSDVLDILESGEKNLTGPWLSLMPDSVRKRMAPDSMAAQQAVEQSVQRTLKKTLGGQFTEKEGILFMQRGYDPTLSEEENAKKLRRAIGTLKIMALAKQKAADYYEKNGTLKGYVGTLYTLKDGKAVKVSKDSFYKMMETEDGRDDSSLVGGIPAVGGTFKGSKVLRVKRVK